MTKRINGKEIAILATDGYEQVELTDPKRNLERAGAKVEVLSIKPGKIKGWDRTGWGKSVKVDHLVSEVHPADYDALVLPGGQINPDKLRTDEGVKALERPPRLRIPERQSRRRTATSPHQGKRIADVPRHVLARPPGDVGAERQGRLPELPLSAAATPKARITDGNRLALQSVDLLP